MKTSLLSLFTATLLGFACRASGHQFDGADFTAILFTTGLVAWTLAQYSRQIRPLSLARPIRFPVVSQAVGARTETFPLAA